MTRPPRAYVDFASVPEPQWKLHERLEDNWKRWTRNPQRQHVSRMFTLVRSDTTARRDRRGYGGETQVPVDRMDAMRIAEAIAHPAFPARHRRVLVWYYLENGKKPAAVAKELGVSLADLAELVKTARVMLKNRGV